jgi:hypothetical protein
VLALARVQVLLRLARVQVLRALPRLRVLLRRVRVLRWVGGCRRRCRRR